MTDTNGDTTPLVPETSPLVEADAKSLQLLLTERMTMIFNTMPSKLSFEDKKAVVAYYRSNREKFMDEEAKALLAGPKVKKTAAPRSVAEVLDPSTVDF